MNYGDFNTWLLFGFIPGFVVGAAFGGILLYMLTLAISSLLRWIYPEHIEPSAD